MERNAPELPVGTWKEGVMQKGLEGLRVDD